MTWLCFYEHVLLMQSEGFFQEAKKCPTPYRMIWHFTMHISGSIKCVRCPSPLTYIISSVQFSYSVMSDSLRPHELQHTVHQQLLEFAQTHVHWVGDAIQSSYPLSSSFPPAFNLSQHQGLFQSVNFLHQVAKVLEFQLQPQSFQWIFRTDFL